MRPLGTSDVQPDLRYEGKAVAVFGFPNVSAKMTVTGHARCFVDGRGYLVVNVAVERIDPVNLLDHLKYCESLVVETSEGVLKPY